MKKRIIALISILLCTAVMLPCFTLADALTLPGELMVIDKESFSGTDALETVIVQKNTKRIESQAFAGSSAKEIYLPESIEYIAEDAFIGCENLRLMVPKDSFAHRWAYETGCSYSVYSGNAAPFPQYTLSDLSLDRTGDETFLNCRISTAAEACRLLIKLDEEIPGNIPLCMSFDIPGGLSENQMQFSLGRNLPDYFILSAFLSDADHYPLCSASHLTEGERPEKMRFARKNFSIALGDTVSPEVYFDKDSEKYAFLVDGASAAAVDDIFISGLALGSARLEAHSIRGLKADCQLSVVEAASGILLDRSELEIIKNANNTFQLTASVLPHGVGSRYFTSSDPSIAKVDRITGVVTPVGSGSCMITVSTYNGHSTECLVTVRGLLEGVKIGIDPGHQARGDYSKEASAPGSSTKKARVSSGAQGKYTRIPEHTTNLQIGLKLRDLLTYFGAEVYMTRETADINISNKERALMMNELGVDMVLRIHCNGSSNKKANGMSIYVRKTGIGKEESAACAKLILNYMQANTSANSLGVKYSDGYTGLNWSTVPSMLLELGYLSNKNEDILLNTPDYQDKLVRGMVSGICEYMGRDLPVYDDYDFSAGKGDAQ